MLKLNKNGEHEINRKSLTVPSLINSENDDKLLTFLTDRDLILQIESAMGIV